MIYVTISFAYLAESMFAGRTIYLSNGEPILVRGLARGVRQTGEASSIAVDLYDGRSGRWISGVLEIRASW